MSIFDFKRKKYRTFLQDSETGEEIAEEYEKGRGVWKKHDVQESPHLSQNPAETFCRILRQVRRLLRSMRKAGESGKSMMFRMGRVRR